MGSPYEAVIMRIKINVIGYDQRFDSRYSIGTSQSFRFFLDIMSINFPVMVSQPVNVLLLFVRHICLQSVLRKPD